MTSLIEQYEQQYAVSTADFTAKIAKLANVERCKLKCFLSTLVFHLFFSIDLIIVFSGQAVFDTGT